MKAKTSQCDVCDQTASGVHFGVLTCEGCKGFFRRSQTNGKSSTYKCNGDENCSLNVFQSCRYCRFKKCLQLGMSYKGKYFYINSFI